MIQETIDKLMEAVSALIIAQDTKLTVEERRTFLADAKGSIGTAYGYASATVL